MWTYRAEIVRVVDGDTLDVDVDLGFGVKKRERLRLGRVDAWETRGVEREAGLEATEFVERALFPGKEVTIQTRKRGKYGRYIAEVSYDGKNLADELLEHGHAEPYGD